MSKTIIHNGVETTITAVEASEIYIEKKREVSGALQAWLRLPLHVRIRKVIEKMAFHLKKESELNGKPISYEDAHKLATQVAYHRDVRRS